MTGKDTAQGQGSGERSDECFKRDDVNRMRGGVMTLLRDVKAGRGSHKYFRIRAEGSLKGQSQRVYM